MVENWQALWLLPLFPLLGAVACGALHLASIKGSGEGLAKIAGLLGTAVVAAGFWGWLIWEQMPDTWSLVGSALVIFGGLLTVYQARQGEVSLSDV